MNDAVHLVEVGPRDGLQNEPQSLSAATKAALVDELAACGLTHIETGSFVSPKWVPQMANSDEVFARIQRRPGVRYAALTPNLRGYEAARTARASEVAVFAAASEAFSQKNINCSIAESIARFSPIVEAAKVDQVPVRGYVSCVMGCPYQGKVAPSMVLDVSQQLLQAGCYEVSLGDTIGVGTPAYTRSLLTTLLDAIPATQLAVHFHDTYGQALANIQVALELGIRVIDASLGGLGGCPYARGASGNVATEDVLYLLQGAGLDTGVDLEALVAASHRICQQLDRPNGSKVAQAMGQPT